MRITNNMLINNMTYNLNGTLQRLERLQYEATAGKRFRVPSDDPIAASKSLKFNTDISKVEQYIRNAKDAQSWMKETESALNEIKAVLHRAKDLTVQAANGTNTDDLDKIKDEIAELKGHLIQIANSTYAGRSLFTGYKTDKKLLNEDGTYAVDLKKDANGKEEIFEYNVGVAETVKINILGNKVFGKATYTNGELDRNTPGYGEDITGGETTGDTPYLIAIFTQLEDALDSKDPDKLQEAIGNIEGSMDQVLSVTAEIGAKMNRLQLTQGKLENQKVSLKELLSFNEDVSLPEAYMKLAIEENVYRASLSVGGRIIQPSLMDFLR